MRFYLRKKMLKFNNLITEAKARGRKLAKEEWVRITLSKSRSSSKYGKEMKRIKRQRHKILMVNR